jgi:transposase InsO family protein
MGNQKTTNSDFPRAIQIAQFRFGLISPVIQGLYPDSSRAEYYRRVTEEPLILPDGRSIQYKAKTIEKWVSLYNRGGFDALMPKERSDKGKTRVLSDDAIEQIYSLKTKFPRLNATQIHARLIQEGILAPTVSVCAVQRFIRQNDLKGARDLNVRDRKAFEEDAFGRMWQADTCFFPYINEGGKSRRVYAVCIIDDHSRMIVGAELFYHDNAAGFQKVFKDAVATYNIPAKLLVDNGAPYANEQLSLICGSIGTALIHTRPRDGAAKGKQERFWRTAKERLIYGLDMETIQSLKQFNSIFRDFVRGYNLTFHTGIQSTPFDRFQATADQARPVSSQEWLEECFLNREWRKVRKDSTVSIASVSYDVPMQFIGMKVEIRFVPDNMDTAFILYEGSRFPIRKTDRNENSRTKRNNPPVIQYSRMDGDSL